MCSSPFATCPDRTGFDYVLFSAVAGGLLSGTLCFVSLDLHEKPPAYSWREYWGVHKAHLSEMIAKFNFRFFELTARVMTIGLFASVCGTWVFMVFFVHILCVIGLMHQSLWRPRQEKNLEQVHRVERRRITVSICKTYRQKWWEKEDDPNPSFRRREVARVLFDLATELFRFKLNR